MALDLGGSSAKVGWSVDGAELIGRRTAPLDEVRAHGRRGPAGSPERLVDGLVRLVAAMVAEPPEGLVPRGVGLVVPGIVDVGPGTAVHSTMLGWRDVPLRALVRDEVGLPVALGHDVTSAAVAEGRLGAARGRRDWLFVALGTGLGSALVLDGTPYRGRAGWGGELGHVVAEPDGPACPCGKRGCLEVLGSGSALPARYADIAPPGTDLPATAAEVARRARTGDALAAAVWDRAVRALVVVLSAACEMLNPALVVVGGGLAGSGAQLFDPLTDGLRRGVRFVRPSPVVVPAGLGVWAGLHGAALAGADLLGVG